MFLASYGNELNRVDFRLLKENKQSSGSLANFSYNGLMYTFQPEVNMFVNQFGHAMDYAQAVALASSLGYSEAEFEGLADNSDTDGGAQRSAPILAQNNLLFAYAAPPYGYPGGATAWPTNYNDQKGLSYFYPHIMYYPGYQGPQPAAVVAGGMNQNTAFDYYGWTGVGTLNTMPGFGSPLSYQYFFHLFPDLNQPHPPANFTFGNSAHGSTALVDHIVDGYSWIPSERRNFSPNKLWSAYSQTSGGVTGNEILFRYNYILFGNSFSNWTASGSASVTSIGHTGPNGVSSGSLSASLISFPGSSTPKLSTGATLAESGATFTYSVFLQGITANNILQLSVTGANIIGTSGSGQITLTTGWNRYQTEVCVSSPSTINFEISGNNGTPGISWASSFRLWGAQAELAEGVDTSSSAYNYYLNTTGTVASARVQSGYKSIWHARKSEYVEKEARNVFNYMISRGFTMGIMSLDDEGYYQQESFGLNSKTTDYAIQYNTFKANNDGNGNSWYVSYTGLSAQPKSMFARTSRFGAAGVTNFKDLLLLRGFTTNATQVGYIEKLNYGVNTNKDTVSGSEPTNFTTSLFQEVTTEMLSYFIEDGIVNPFKELMIGNTSDESHAISNYGYVDGYAAFIGNTYLDSSGTPTPLNLLLPTYDSLYPNTDSMGRSPSKYRLFDFKDDHSYSNDQLAYHKSGTRSSTSTYGTFIGSPTPYGDYITDTRLRPNSGDNTSLINNMGARGVFDRNRTITGNSYGYSGASWGNVPNAAYVIGQPTGISRVRQVHIPGKWRGITMAGGNGFTFSCTFCSDSMSATFTGVSAGYGVTCLGCNDQTTYTLDYFFNDLWGITQANDAIAPVGIIPISARAAIYGYTQGQLSAEWARAANGATNSNYFTPCGTPVPGVTLLPGSIFRNYDTHWYPLGWMGFITDLGQHREVARTEVFNAIVERNRLGDPSIPQKPYQNWVHVPSFGISSILNTWSTTDTEYKNNISPYFYLKPTGITYDIVRDYWDGSISIRGATIFYGDINHYWAENIRHAYLHKMDTIEQWGSPSVACIMHPDRTEFGVNYNQTFGPLARWPVTNPSEVAQFHPKGASAMFNAPGGVSGFTLGGVCADKAWLHGGYRINKVVENCNNMGGGIVHETMYLAPINWREKEYAFSGAQLKNGTYLWRITFLHKATQAIYVKGSRLGDSSGATYNIAGITNFIDNGNNEKGLWWTSNVYELPIVTNPPTCPTYGLPAGTTTWNGTLPFNP